MKIQYLTLLFVLLFGCRAAQLDKVQETASDSIPVREHSVQAVLWQQQSAEYKALCYQAFNIAKMQIDKSFQQITMDNRPMAIITDIDETVLDNSPYNAKMIEEDKEYTKADWIEWGQLKNANPVPGALEFFKYAASKGVEVFYISNRYALQQPETQENLAKLGFPNVDDEHILLRTSTSGKEERRNMVTNSHRVMLLLGDNLSDFNAAFDQKPSAERHAITDKMKDKFGTTFIVLPNPMYGDWETKGIYEGKYDWSSAQKDSIRKAKLISY